MDEELKKQDKLTPEEEADLDRSCEAKYGIANFHNYKKLANVLDKVLHQVRELQVKRDNQVLQADFLRMQDVSSSPIPWTNLEVAQLLIGVFHFGEGEWQEIQRRINFSSSGLLKTPNQLGHKWRQIKRVMKRDLKRLRRSLNGNQLVTKQDWII